MILAKQFRAFLFSILLCLCFGAQKGFAQSVVSAFSYSENDSLDQSIARSSSIDQNVQSWSIVINDELRELSSGEIFTLPLPTGELIEAEVASRIEHANQDLQLIASVIEGGSIVLTIGYGAVFGSINTESASFSISSNEQEVTLVDNQSMLAELDMGNDMMIPPIPFKERVSNRIGRFATPQNTSSSTIDLLVVYSNEFADVFSSPETRINQLVSFSNTSFADSGILLNLRLVAAVELEFNNSSSVSTHLSNATDGVGDFTGLAQLRNQYGADLVAVLSANISNPFSASGVAWVNGD
nr:hypothetical protein [Acidiferrobacterales bacterium]